MDSITPGNIGGFEIKRQQTVLNSELYHPTLNISRGESRECSIGDWELWGLLCFAFGKTNYTAFSRHGLSKFLEGKVGNTVHGRKLLWGAFSCYIQRCTVFSRLISKQVSRGEVGNAVQGGKWLWGALSWGTKGCAVFSRRFKNTISRGEVGATVHI